MRKKLDTRFPAARIKKIMQADEEVGKIALATPILISKALELFLQDLCDKTYEITLRRGAKTLSALHLKQCVQTNSVFDFLQEIVSKVPDIGAETGDEERNGGRRRKVSDGDNDSDEDVKRPKAETISHPSGRGRGRGRGRGGRSRRAELAEDKYEDADLDFGSDRNDRFDSNLGNGSPKQQAEELETKELSRPQPRDFDLNMDLDENGDVAAPQVEAKEESQPLDWSHEGGDHVDIGAVQLHLNPERHVQDEDDYDCEDDEDA